MNDTWYYLMIARERPYADQTRRLRGCTQIFDFGLRLWDGALPLALGGDACVCGARPGATGAAVLPERQSANPDLRASALSPFLICVRSLDGDYEVRRLPCGQKSAAQQTRQRCHRSRAVTSPAHLSKSDHDAVFRQRPSGRTLGPDRPSPPCERVRPRPRANRPP